MKTLIYKTLCKLGLEVRLIRKEDIALYESNYPPESIAQKRFYNIGAGGFCHSLWTNVDHRSEWYERNSKFTEKGIDYDLFSLTSIPIEDAVAEIVYSSHTIEHIQDEHAQHCFNEIFRILKTGGIFRVTAPDIDLHYKAYLRNDRDFYYWKDAYAAEKDYRRIALDQPLAEASIAQLFIQRFAGAVSVLHADGAKERIADAELHRLFSELPYEEVLDYCCNKCPVEIQKKYPGNHLNWWNAKKTVRMLKRAGFQDVSVSGYGQSRTAVLRDVSLFDSTHPQISFYVEASK